MRSAKMYYLGIISMFIGTILTSMGVYYGSSTKFHSTLAEQAETIMMGIGFLVAGILLWLLFEE